MRIEFGFLIVFLISLVFKFENWDKIGILPITFLPSVSIIYIVGSFFLFCDKEIKRQSIPFSVISGIFIALIPLGIVFKLQHWPGAQMILTTSFIFMIILLIVSILLKKNNAKDELDTYYKKMIFRISFFIFLSGFFSKISSNTLIKFQYRKDPELARLKILCNSDRQNLEYRKQLEEYIAKTDSLQKETNQ